MELTIAKPPSKWRFLVPFTGLALLFAAPPAYLLFMDQPFLRKTAAVSFAMIFLGVAIGILGAMIHPRRWSKILAAIQIALAGFMIYAWVFWARLPLNHAPIENHLAPEFATVDQNEQPFELRKAHKDGPVLLVFYRGYW